MNIFSKIGYHCSSKYLQNLIKPESTFYKVSYSFYSSVKLNEILVEAEKVIRVPLSQFNMKYLLKDEFDIRIFTINKVNSKYIAETNHPIVEIAKNIFQVDENDKSKLISYRGSLILLLIAKLCESLPSFKLNESFITKQCDFAEIYEMINKALIIHHEAVVNLPSGSDAIKPEIKRLNDANKISILGGDYLLSYAIVRLANLIHNTFILQLIMCAIDDYCIYHFNGVRDSDGNLMPKKDMSILDWEEMAGYSLTKLLAYCCQIMLLLAKQSDRYQKAAFDFGYNLQLIWNLKEELQSFSDPNQNYSLNLMSAPVIFHMEYDHNFSNFIKSFSSIKNVDCAKMMQIISEGPAIDKCHKQLDLYTHKAMKALDLFPNSVAKEILESTIIA